MKRYEFAEQISVDETYLSQIINHHRTPSEEVLIRLELHSKNMITALIWYKIVGKEQENKIDTDKALRKKENKNVKSSLKIDLAKT